MSSREIAPPATAPSQLWTFFGPGVLWAATAIGVSHLVQSTRAGASAGFGLAGVILAALVLKYPFFEYGPRYAAATGESLVEGYARIGRWALWLYLVITVLTNGVVQSAIVMFTAYLVGFSFGLTWPLAVLAAIVMAPGVALLWWGRFRGLDLSVKGIVLLLSVSTLLAAAVSVPRADFATLAVWPAEMVGTAVPFVFLLALAGWMPSAIDISVWSSLWTLAKNDASGQRCTVETARKDFLVGYLGTAVLAFAFVLLGAAVMFGSGATFAPEGTLFSTQLVDLYSATLGAWMRPIVLVAVVTTMLSTTLTVLDGGPRAIERSIRVLRSKGVPVVAPEPCGPVYWWSLTALVVLTLVVMGLFIGNLTTMIDFATTLAFLTGPVLGYLNLCAVTSKEMPEEHRPGRAMLAFSWVGIVLLGGTGIFYLLTFVS
ncbi:MAG: divalent metal cation transporter [Acidobacteriota bacterium]|nr:divalent metal cation transporter [Acidobacteriota bacterium]